MKTYWTCQGTPCFSQRTTCKMINIQWNWLPGMFSQCQCHPWVKLAHCQMHALTFEECQQGHSCLWGFSEEASHFSPSSDHGSILTSRSVNCWKNGSCIVLCRPSLRHRSPSINIARSSVSSFQGMLIIWLLGRVTGTVLVILMFSSAAWISCSSSLMSLSVASFWSTSQRSFGSSTWYFQCRVVSSEKNDTTMYNSCWTWSFFESSFWAAASITLTIHCCFWSLSKDFLSWYWVRMVNTHCKWVR